MAENPYKSPEAEGTKHHRSGVIVPAPLAVAMIVSKASACVAVGMTQGKHWSGWLLSGIFCLVAYASTWIIKRDPPAPH